MDLGLVTRRQLAPQRRPPVPLTQPSEQGGPQRRLPTDRDIAGTWHHGYSVRGLPQQADSVPVDCYGEGFMLLRIAAVAAVSILAGPLLTAPAGAARAPELCAGQPVTKHGTNGADVIHGTPHRDVIDGRGGNDRIYGLGGNDVLCGAGGNDRLLGGGGADHLAGDLGDDYARGGPGRDILRGGIDNDVLWGRNGADRATGGAGVDIVGGGNGADSVGGGQGNDTVYGAGGADRIFGFAGDDTLVGGLGLDRLHGGVGNDNLDGVDHAPGDLLNGGPGSGDVCTADRGDIKKECP
jgi:Ca2+-binding RTX toxin-like protein